MSQSREWISQALNWRYATKTFDPSKKIADADWKILEQSLIQSPSSYGLQPWKFIVVQNPELRAKLREVSWNQGQVTDCSHYVVLTVHHKVDEAHIQKFIQTVSQTRGVPLEQLKGYQDMMIGDVVKGPRSQIAHFWAQRQAYIAMGFLMETAALLQVDACPMEGIDPGAYDKLLGLESTPFRTVATVALGYRSSQDHYSGLKKVRFSSNDVLEWRK